MLLVVPFDKSLTFVQVDHDARPSVSVDIRRSLEEYLKKGNLATGIDTIQKLQSECGIKLVMTRKDDPDGIDCFVQWRIAFYVAGGEAALHNFFMFLDGYLEFKCKQFARATPFEVKIHPYDPFLLASVCHRPVSIRCSSTVKVPLNV